MGNLKQKAMTVEGPLSRDIGWGPKKTSHLFNTWPPLEVGINIISTGDSVDPSFANCSCKEDGWMVGPFLGINLPKENRELFKGFNGRVFRHKS
jgi:hypothetical protein